MVTQSEAVKKYLNCSIQNEMLNKRIDDMKEELKGDINELREELKDDILEIKYLIKQQMERHDKVIDCHDNDIEDLKQTKWKVIAFSGAVAFVTAIGLKIIFK